MDYKYIEQLMERYWAAEATLEEERILRAFFSQGSLPAELEQWSPLFAAQAEGDTLGDDFDVRMLAMVGETADDQQPVTVKAREVKLSQWLMPLFKAAAVVAIILTLGNAAQTPWDASWQNQDVDYASIRQEVDTVLNVSPVQAENISDMSADSCKVR